jgi:hypothetical protein
MAQFHRSSILSILFGFIPTRRVLSYGLLAGLCLACTPRAYGLFGQDEEEDTTRSFLYQPGQKPVAGGGVTRTTIRSGHATAKKFDPNNKFEQYFYGKNKDIPQAWFITAAAFGLLHGCLSQKLFEVSGKNNGLLLSLLASVPALYGHAKVNGSMYRNSNGVYTQYPRTYLALHALMQLAGQWLVAKKIGPVTYPLSPTWLVPGLLAVFPFWDASRFVSGMPR